MRPDFYNVCDIWHLWCLRWWWGGRTGITWVGEIRRGYGWVLIITVVCVTSPRHFIDGVFRHRAPFDTFPHNRAFLGRFSSKCTRKTFLYPVPEPSCGYRKPFAEFWRRYSYRFFSRKPQHMKQIVAQYPPKIMTCWLFSHDSAPLVPVPAHTVLFPRLFSQSCAIAHPEDRLSGISPARV